jgi:hypothetical protein
MNLFSCATIIEVRECMVLACVETDKYESDLSEYLEAGKVSATRAHRNLVI